MEAGAGKAGKAVAAVAASRGARGEKRPGRAHPGAGRWTSVVSLNTKIPLHRIASSVTDTPLADRTSFLLLPSDRSVGRTDGRMSWRLDEVPPSRVAVADGGAGAALCDELLVLRHVVVPLARRAHPVLAHAPEAVDGDEEPGEDGEAEGDRVALDEPGRLDGRVLEARDEAGQVAELWTTMVSGVVERGKEVDRP